MQIQRNTLLSLVSHTSLVTQEVDRYKEHAWSNPIDMVGNPLGWWKDHGHHFPTLSRLARRFLTISTTSCPVERLFSVAGQVDAARRGLQKTLVDSNCIYISQHSLIKAIRGYNFVRVHRCFRKIIRPASLSPDTMTLLVFLHEALPLVRKIRVSRIVRSALED